MPETQRVEIFAGIEAVTVYNDRARVTRRGKAAIAAGRSTLVFGGLTAGLDEGSLRVHFAESPGVRVIGISADWEGHTAPSRDEEAKLVDAIEALTKKVRAIDDRAQALRTRFSLIDQYQQHARDAISRKASSSEEDSDDWTGALRFLAEEAQRTQVALRKTDKELHDIHEELQARQAELQRLRAPASRHTRRVEVVVEAEAKVDEGLVALDYVVFDAWWAPAYDARAVNGSLDLTWFGTVTQGTGEDWERVKLVLSTARPSESARIPRLTPVQLSGYKREKRPVEIVSYGKAADKSRERGDEKADGMAPEEPEPMVEFGGEGGRVEPTDTGDAALVFAIKGAETIPADRRPHKVEILTAPLEPEIGYETIPKIAPWVYLKASAENTTDFPILPGPVNVFGASGYVGSGHLEHVAPGERFAVSLGTDEHVKVRRIIDERVDAKPKILGSTRSLSFAYRIEVSNFREEPTRLTVVENVPVSEREEIEIELSEATTGPTDRDDDGFVKWTFQLDPEEERTIEFGYLVRYPKDWTLHGL